jgi:hypothetical protein
MINQQELDNIVLRLQNKEEVFLYYVAHYIELREGIIDEHQYKSVNKFRPVKVKITDVNNAYTEVLRYKNHPQDFHIETEEEWYDEITKYIHYYTVPNDSPFKYDLNFNSRIPSIVYGYRRKVYKNDGAEEEFNDPSIVVPIYTNNPEFGDLRGTELKNAISEGKLDWKYIYTETPIETDGIEYNYITSDYYILDIENFPRTEKPLINVKQKNAYFLNICDAFNYIKQLEA